MTTRKLNPRSLYGVLVLVGGLGLIAVITAKWNLPAANLKALLVTSLSLLSIGLVGQLQRPARAQLSRAATMIRRRVPG